MADLRQEAAFTIKLEDGAGPPAAAAGGGASDDFGRTITDAFDALLANLRRAEADATDATARSRSRTPRPDPAPFDPAVLARKRIEDEAKARQVEDEYRKQLGLPDPDQFDPAAVARERLAGERRRKAVDAEYRKQAGLPDPDQFDPAAAAQSRVGREAKQKAEDAEYYRLTGKADPGVFDAAVEARKRIEAEARQRAVDAEYRKQVTGVERLGLAARDATRWLGTFGDGLRVLNGFIQNEIRAAAGELSSNRSLIESRSEASKGRFDATGAAAGAAAPVAGAVIGAKVGAGAGSVGGPAGAAIGAAAGAAIGGAIQAAISGLGRLFNAKTDDFLAKSKELRDRAGQLAPYGQELAAAQALARANRLRRDVGEANAIGPQLADLTRSEDRYNRVEQQIKAINRAKEAQDAAKKFDEQKAEREKELARLIREGGAQARRIADAVAGDGKSALQKLLAGVKVPGDARADAEKALDKLRDSEAGGPIFGEGP